MFLRAVYFAQGVSVMIGGKYSAITFWDFEKHPDIFAEEKDNGDVWLTTAWDGRRRRVRAHSVSWVLEEMPQTGAELTKIEAALGKRREAEKMYAEKFKKPIAGTEQKK